MKTLIKQLILISSLITSISYAQNIEAPSIQNLPIAKNFSQSLEALHNRWGIVNYTLSGEEQNNAFEQLEQQASTFNNNFVNKAETWVWLGIIESSHAGSKGGFGALFLVKKAKESLEKALAIDDKALLGSAYTSLGTLYHKVPSWPISFGDDDDAIKYLKKALVIDPNGIDPNYFYGELLYDKKKYQKAMQYLSIAQKSPVVYPSDEFRKVDIDLLIGKVKKKLAKKKH